MALWFVLALMTAAAVFAVLWPLGQRGAGRNAPGESAVYRDQLAEVERDRASGLIGAAEADAARIEISRRLLAAPDANDAGPGAGSLRLRRVVAIVALIGLPLIGAGLYLHLGTPTMPDFPLAARARAPLATDSLDRLVAQVEAHLEKNPADGRGWEVLAPVLARLGRDQEAVTAFRNALTHNGETAARRSNLGEALVVAAGGVVTADAKSEFRRAVELDAGEAKARFFLGLAAEQDGRPDEAAAAWRALLADAPADAIWRPMVAEALARVAGPQAPAQPQPQAQAPGPTQEQMAAAAGMSEGERTAMIRGMVEGLAARLKDNGDDVQGWLRLARAYMVLGEPDKARATREDARKALHADDARLRQLNDGLKALGL